MQRIKFGISALAAILLFAARPAGAQTLCSFSGSGTVGTDCFGQAWVTGEGGWGIPGLGQD